MQLEGIKYWVPMEGSETAPVISSLQKFDYELLIENMIGKEITFRRVSN